MKKILIGLATIIAFIIIGYKVSYSKAGNQTETGSEDLYDSGTDHQFRVGSDGTIYTTEGFPHSVEWNDIPASSTGAFCGTDGIEISTSSLVSGGTTYVVGTTGTKPQFTQITFPRNVVCKVNFMVDNATATVTGSLLVSGKDHKGNSTTETISVSTGTTAIPGKGVKAWSFIDSFAFSGFIISNSTQSAVEDANAHIWIGTGEKLGLGYDVIQATDVYKFTVDNVDYSTCCYKSNNGVSPTYDTVDTEKLGAVPLIPNAARDYRYWLKTGITH